MERELLQILASLLIFVAAFIAIYIVSHYFLKAVKRKVNKHNGLFNSFLIDILKVPVLWLLFWALLSVFGSSVLAGTKIYPAFTKINNLLLVFTTGWIFIKFVRAMFHYMERKLSGEVDDNNYVARKELTELKIFEGIIVGAIGVITIGICLMTFDKIRVIGVGLLSSAGVLGIIVGFAAQKSIGAVFAGIQIAMTQPIRLGDSVIVQDEKGSIEEINLTYVLVKLDDGGRMILPINYFLENPFHNLTHTIDASILATVYLDVKYKLPVDELRKQLSVYLENNPKWDGNIADIQVSDAKENYKELRILMSASDTKVSWDLCVDIREKMIDFVNENYPDCFAENKLDDTSGN